MDTPRKKTGVMSLLPRLLRFTQRFHALRVRNRLLRERHIRIFQRRLAVLRQEIAAQAEREGFAKSLDAYLIEVERRTIELALEHSDGDVLEAAILLGIPSNDLEKMMESHGSATKKTEGPTAND